MNNPRLYFSSICIVALFTLLFAACKKELYDGPIDSTYDKKFWTSQSSVEQAAIAMYGQLRANIRHAGSDMKEASHFVFGDLVTGVFVPGGQDVFLKYGLTASAKFNFSYVPYWGPSLTNWSRFYQLISQANLILQTVPQMQSSLFASEQAKNSYLGEALFMRAYTYFYITRVWGDPVYVTRTFDGSDYGNLPPIARTDEAIVLDSCIRDLKIAAGYLTYAGGDPAKSIRANKGSVYALLAHMYAWKHAYDSAHVYCRKVIDEGGYSLESMDTYTNIWKGMTSAESIFEVPMLYNAGDPNFKNGNEWAEAQFNCFATFLKEKVVDDRKSSCWMAPENSMLDNTLFDTLADARYAKVFRRMPASGGDPAGHMLTKYTNFTYGTPDTKSYAYINNDLVLMRLADIYLLDAEALAYTGNLEGARTALSVTQKRANISNYMKPSNNYDMIDEVILERGRELVGEGLWFYDLIRTEQTQHWLEFIGYPADRVTKAAKGYYWPLDMNTLFPYDNLLTQNPYWASHSR